MRNRELAYDYIRRAGNRVKSLEVLYELQSWPDVVCEAQEIVELAMRALLRIGGVEPPATRDFSEILVAERERLPEPIQPHVDALALISRELRRDRELAFYGSEDLTPSKFYTKQDADRAREQASFTVITVKVLFADSVSA